MCITVPRGEKMETLEVLLDLSDGSRKELVLVKDTALESIRKEIRHHYQEPHIQLCCGNHGLETTGPKYMLQRWSSKWSEHVDIISSEDIKSGDKLRVLPKSTVSKAVLRKIKHANIFICLA